MLRSWRRAISALLCATLTLQPLAATAAATQQYRIPLKLDATSEGKLVITPNPVDFGDVARTQMRQMSVTVTNEGTATATSLRATTTGPFDAEVGGCASLAPGAQCTLLARFMPATSGPQFGNLKLTGEGASGEADLIGNAVPLITDLELSQGGWNFGTWKVGETSTAKQLAVKNVGNGPIVISKLYLFEGSDDYSLSHTCGSALTPGATCIVTVTFTPAELGQRVGSFRIRSGDGSIRDFGMLGFGGQATNPDEGQTDGKLSSPDSLAFGETVIGAGDAVKQVVLANTGSRPLPLKVVGITGKEGDAFKAQSACPAVLDAYATCSVSVSFNPGKVAPYGGILAVEAGADTQIHNIALSGHGVAAAANANLSTDVTEVDFGSTPLTIPVSRKVRITNAGPEVATVTQTYATNSANFIVTEGCDKPLAAGQSCELGVQFTAKSRDRSTGELVIGSQAGQVLQVNLKGMVPEPILEISPASLSFATTLVGVQSPVNVFTITNQGSAPLQISEIGLVNEAEFAQSNNCADSLESGASCQVSVIFKPTSGGLSKTDLIVNSNDALVPTATLPLQGIGSAGSLSVAPQPVDFGEVQVGTQTEPIQLTVLNGEPGNVWITGVTLGGSAYSQTNTCGKLLEKSQQCSVDVTFKPTSEGAANGYMLVSTSDSSVYCVVPLRGRGFSASQALTLSKDTVGFGVVELDKTSTRTLTATNRGAEPLSIGPITVGGDDATAFQVSSTCEGQLAGLGTCDIQLTYKATAIKAQSAQVSVKFGKDGASKTASLSGRGVERLPEGILSATPNPVDFGAAEPSAPASVVVHIANSGPDSVGIESIDSSDTNNFSWDSTACTTALAANAGCDLTVTFHGVSQGKVTGELTLISDIGQKLNVPLLGQGPAPRIDVSKSELDFGTVELLGASAEQVVGIRNLGNASLQLTGLGTDGPFSQRNDCPGTLPPGGQCTAWVSYGPTAASVQNGGLTIDSSDSTNRSIRVGLKGEGLAGQLLATPESLNFGELELGAQTSRVLLLSNPGPGNTPLNSITLDGPNKAAFSYESSCGSLLTNGTTCPVTVRFSALNAGNHQATLTVIPSIGSSVIVPLTGYGPPAHASVDTSSLAFDDTAVSFTSATQAVRLVNDGNVPLNVYGIEVSAGNESFAATHDCKATLAVGEACSVVVAFTPAAGGFQTGVLRLTTANSSGPLDVLMAGTGLVPTANVSADRLDFGALYVGTNSERAIQLTNTSGSVSMAVYGIGVGDASWFQQNNTCGQGLNPGASCDIVIQAGAPAAGEKTSQLTLLTSAGTLVVELSVLGKAVTISRILPSTASSAGGTLISVMGQGFDPATRVYFDGVLASSHQFRGDSQIDAVAPAHVPGLVDVRISTGSAPDVIKIEAVRYVDAPTISSISPASGSVAGGWTSVLSGTGFVSGMTVLVEGKAADVVSILPDGTSASIVVPARNSVSAGTVDLVVTTPAGSVAQAGAMTYVLPPAQISLTGASGNFGNIAVGASYSRFVTVKNEGPVAVQLAGFTLDATDPTVFTVGTGGTCSASSPLLLASNTSCSVELIAMGTEVEAVTGSMKVSVAGEAESPAKLDLSVAFVEPDYALSSNPSTLTAVSGNFPSIVAYSEQGGTNGTQTKTIYLSNLLKAAGSRIESPVVTITGPDAGQFQIVEVLKVANSGGTQPAGASISDDKLSATGATVDVGNGTYPHLGVTIKYAPKFKGEFNAQLNIAYNSNYRAQLPLYGKADFYSNAALSASGTYNPAVGPNGDFGALTYNDAPGLASESLTRTFYVVSKENIGKLLQVSRMQIIGGDADSFSIVGYSGRLTSDGEMPATDLSPKQMRQTLSTSQALSVTVRYSPTRVGSQTAQLLISHNGDNVSPLTLDLLGAGAHDVSVQASGGSYIADIPAFPKVAVGGSAVLNTYARNTGTYGQVTWKAIQIVGSQDFSIDQVSQTNNTGGTSTNTENQPPATRYVAMNFIGTDAHVGGQTDLRARIKFSPTSTGQQSAIVTVFHDGPGGKTSYVVTGEGLRAAAGLSGMSGAPADGDLGTTSFTALNDATNGSLSRSFEISNTNGLGLLKITRLRITGEDAGAFVIDSYDTKPTGYTPSNDVYPTSMVQSTPTTTFSLKVKFVPIKLGSHTGQLEIYHDGMNESPIVLPMTAAGTRDVVLTVSESGTATVVEPTPFAATIVGNNAPDKTVYLRATGTSGAVTYTGFSLEGSTDFVVATASNYYKGSTQQYTPSRLDYSTQPGGGVTSGTSNWVGANVSTSGYTDFGLKIRFKPTSLGKKSVKVTITHNGPGGKSTFVLSGEGTLPNAELSGTQVKVPTVLNNEFGVVSVNPTTGVAESSSKKNYVVNTNGVGLLNISRMVITGPDAANFTVTTWDGFTSGDAPGGDVSPKAMKQTTYLSAGPGFSVKFTPSRIGLHSAQIAIYHNGGNASPLVMPLSGTGAYDVKVEVSQSSTAIAAPEPFTSTTVVGNKATKTIYLHVSGNYGQVTYTGFKVEGSNAFGVGNSLYLTSKPSGSSGSVLIKSYTTPVQSDAFNIVGEDISKDRTDLRFDLVFTPTKVGEETATVTLFHTGPGGKTTFTISAKGAMPIAALSANSALPVVAPDGRLGVTAYNGATGAPAGTITKSFYVVNSNATGLVQVNRMRIVGADANAFSIVNWSYYTATPPGYTPQDISPVGMKQPLYYTALLIKVSFTPTKLGTHHAQLVVDHNGANPALTLNLSGEGARDITAMYATEGVTPDERVTDMPPVSSYNNAAYGTSNKTVFIRAQGTRGNVTYSGFKVEGSSAFAVSQVYKVIKGSTSRYSLYTYSPAVNNASAVHVGADLATSSNAYTDYALVIVFAPAVAGTHKATVTVFHDGPGGQTTFELSGTAQTEMQLSSRPDAFDSRFVVSTPQGESAALLVYARKLTGDNLQLGTLSLSGEDADQFILTRVENLADTSSGMPSTTIWQDAGGVSSVDINAVLATTGSGVITVEYRPTRQPSGLSHSATLTVTRPGYAAQAVALTGTSSAKFATFQSSTNWSLFSANMGAKAAISNAVVPIGAPEGITSGKWYFEVAETSAPPAYYSYFSGGKTTYVYPGTNNGFLGVAVGSKSLNGPYMGVKSTLNPPSGYTPYPSLYSYSAVATSGNLASYVSNATQVTGRSVWGVALDYDNKTVDVYLSEGGTSACTKVVSFQPNSSGLADTRPWYPLLQSVQKDATFALSKGEPLSYKCIPAGYAPLRN